MVKETENKNTFEFRYTASEIKQTVENISANVVRMNRTENREFPHDLVFGVDRSVLYDIWMPDILAEISKVTLSVIKRNSQDIIKEAPSFIATLPEDIPSSSIYELDYAIFNFIVNRLLYEWFLSIGMPQASVYLEKSEQDRSKIKSAINQRKNPKGRPLFWV